MQYHNGAMLNGMIGVNYNSTHPVSHLLSNISLLYNFELILKEYSSAKTVIRMLLPNQNILYSVLLGGLSAQVAVKVCDPIKECVESIYSSMVLSVTSKFFVFITPFKLPFNEKPNRTCQSIVKRRIVYEKNLVCMT